MYGSLSLYYPSLKPFNKGHKLQYFCILFHSAADLCSQKLTKELFSLSHPFVILQDTANSAEGGPQENDGSEACQSEGALAQMPQQTITFSLSSFFLLVKMCATIDRSLRKLSKYSIFNIHFAIRYCS
jgi:hypothetical protein